MNKMIVANLVHRPIRSIISIFAVAVEVTLILMIVGLALGILDDNKSRQVGIGADLTVLAARIFQSGRVSAALPYRCAWPISYASSRMWWRFRRWCCR